MQYEVYIKSSDEEEIDVLAERSPQIKKAVGVLKELSADERTRMLYENHEMVRRDIESKVEEVDKKWQSVLTEKDAELAEKDAEIAEKDAEIADLKEQLNKKK